MTPITNTSRRGFLRGTAMTAGGIFMPNIILSQEGGSKKLNFAGIGVGGKGESDIANAAKAANIVAVCDVDRNTLKKAKDKYKDAQAFEDFREMFDKMGDKIDGVIISTPDHAHYPAAMEAIHRGKHVCVQKPLVNRIWEANQLHQAAKKKGVHTNMGNQGHTGEGIRILKEWIGAGAIGKVKEIHVWTNRPIWPQGNQAKEKMKGGKEAPENLNWKSWLAQSPDVPYIEGVHPFAWRGHLEYGAGAMGDMGCHILDGPFWSCELGEPYKLEAECEELTDVSWPKSSKVNCYFNTKMFGEIKLVWYEGGKKPERPKDLDAGRNWDEMKGGFLMMGEEGTILNTDDYCSSPRIIPQDKMAEFSKNKKVEKTLERSLAPGEPQIELIKAVEQNKIAGSNFDYAVPLTKLCLLGNLAIHNHGKTIEWDSEKQEVKGNADANKSLKRDKCREGWDYSADKI